MSWMEFFAKINNRLGTYILDSRVLINDVNNIFDKTFCQPDEITSLTLNILLHADDLVLISETSSGLQNRLDKLQEYCKKWGLTVNIKKTKPVVVEKRQSPLSLSGEKGRRSRKKPKNIYL